MSQIEGTGKEEVNLGAQSLSEKWAKVRVVFRPLVGLCRSLAQTLTSADHGSKFVPRVNLTDMWYVAQTRWCE